MTKLALVTGGQQGIGLGICTVLIDAGFHVAIASEQPADAPSVKMAMHALGDRARYYTHDLLDVAQVSALLDAVEADMGEITAFVSNAGIPAKLRGDMLDITAGNFDIVMGVNMRGAFFLAQALAKRMLARGSDHYRSLCFVTSVSAQMVSVERAEYCISKAAASMMTQLFAVRMAPHGIGVFEIRPGIIETEMTAGVKDKYTARIEQGLVPAARWGQPGDIGQVIGPIVSGQMAFATGAVIPVDGGLSIARL
jgi:NAD(P)-dependent dehydrogenase (short-subunit alcohol dehydrogenase family)